MNIFQNPTKMVPKSDPQIVRVTMKENEVAGRTDHMPKDSASPSMSISHVPNKG